MQTHGEAVADPERLRQQRELHQALRSDALAVRHIERAEFAEAGIGATVPAITDYEILEELGHGAMGVIYRARQIPLNRVVALKMIVGGAYASHAALARFRAEAQVRASLQHPNVIQIYEIGQYENHVFCALEYVDGGDLAQKLADSPLPSRQTAHLLKVVADAMHCVHEHGIVHRDLKPANVLLTAAGVPKVSDFALARRLDLATGQTQSGELLGTPRYMAPEQAAGRTSGVGPSTDIYALGAILYEVLTGRPPFVASTWFEAVQQIQNSEPIPPTRLQPRIPRDLEATCLNCLEKEPGRRYASAAALAKDLEAFLTGEPVAGRHMGPLARAVRWARHRQNARLDAALQDLENQRVVPSGMCNAFTCCSRRRDG